jgi:hypothetical protein
MSENMLVSLIIMRKWINNSMTTGHTSKNWGFICPLELYLIQHAHNLGNINRKLVKVYNSNIISRGQGGSAVWKYVDFFDWDKEVKLFTQWKLVMPQQTEIFIWHHELYLTQHETNLGKSMGT